MNAPHWTDDEIAFFERMVKDGAPATHLIVRRMEARFSHRFTRSAVLRRLRAKGYGRASVYATGTRERLLAFWSQHPELGAYRVAWAFNKQTGAGIYGQLARFWRQQGAA